MITRLGTKVGTCDEMRLRSGHRVGVSGPANAIPTSAAEARAMLMRDAVVMPEEHAPAFREGLAGLLARWTALQLAILNEWGGAESAQKGDAACDELADWFLRRKGGKYAEDLEELLIEILGAFYTLVPIRPRTRGERRSLRTLPGVSLRPSLAFNPRHRRLSTPLLTPFNSTPTSLCMERPLGDDFNVQCEDGSPREVAKVACEMYERVAQGDYAVAREVCARPLPREHLERCKRIEEDRRWTAGAAATGGGGGGDGGGSGEEMEMDADDLAEGLGGFSMRDEGAREAAAEARRKAAEPDEDGWCVVPSRR